MKWRRKQEHISVIWKVSTKSCDCSDDDSNSNLPAKKCGCAITQPSYQLNTFHHAMNVYYDSLSLSFSVSYLSTYYVLDKKNTYR